MKRLIISGSICALWLLASCSPGEGNLASCASSYVGSFEGMVMLPGMPPKETSGEMIGWVDVTNSRLLTVVTGEFDMVRTYNSNSEIADGEVKESSGNQLTLQGEFDFDDCVASGTWAVGAAAQGTWRLELPDSAF